MKKKTNTIYTANLSLRERPVDIFFMIIFSAFFVTSCIADMIPALGLNFDNPSANFILNANHWYAEGGTDKLFQNPPFWMKIIISLSAFVYMPFYAILVFSIWRGWNRIQLPCVIYATMIACNTGIIVFGVEFFGEVEWRTENPAKFLAFNLPYVLIPISLLVRMRKPMPFTRKF